MDKRNNGLELAFGLVDYDGNTVVADERDYGEIKASFKRWTPSSKTAFDDVVVRPCSE